MSIAQGVRPEWVASNNFVMIHLDLVDALDGSWEAAGLLNRIMFRAGKDGWWTATLEEIREDCRLTEHKMKRSLQELRDAGMVEGERVNPFNSTMRWRVVFSEDVPVARDGGGILPGGGVTSFAAVEETSVPSSLEERVEQVRTPPTPSVVNAAFDQWWSQYPRKVGKAAARRAYAKAVKSVTADELLEALVLQRGALAQELERGFCPHPATWLNQGRWEDDVTAISMRREDNGKRNRFIDLVKSDTAESMALLGIEECR